jgi:hypothetical protein
MIFNIILTTNTFDKNPPAVFHSKYKTLLKQNTYIGVVELNLPEL